MSTILVPDTFTDTSLPVDSDLRTFLAAKSELHSWFQADIDYATVASGAVSSLKTLKPASAIALAQATAANRGVLSAKAAIGGYDALDFDGSNDRYDLATAPDFSNPFSVVMLAQVTSLAASNNLFGRFTGPAQQTTIQSGTFGLLYYQGGASGTIANAANFAAGVPHLIIAGASGGVARAKADNLAPVTFAAAGAASSAAIAIGALSSGGAAPLGGWVSDVMIFAADLLAAGNETLLANVRAYFAGTYGLPLS